MYLYEGRIFSGGGHDCRISHETIPEFEGSLSSTENNERKKEQRMSRISLYIQPAFTG